VRGYGCTSNAPTVYVAHTVLGSTATGTARHSGKSPEKSQSDTGYGVSPTLPGGSAAHSLGGSLSPSGADGGPNCAVLNVMSRGA
jgi:hypothetical protein